jgi:hypothetical protein
VHTGHLSAKRSKQPEQNISANDEYVAHSARYALVEEGLSVGDSAALRCFNRGMFGPSRVVWIVFAVAVLSACSGSGSDSSESVPSVTRPVEPSNSVPVTPTTVKTAQEARDLQSKIDAERQKREADRAAAEAAATLSACLASPPFTAVFLPDEFSNQLLPGSGGQVTIGPEGSISPIEPIDPTVYHYAGSAGRYIDIVLGEYAEQPLTTEPITVLGHEARFGAIEDGYSVQFSVADSKCESYTMLAYGVTEADARQVFAGLTLHA